MSFSSIFYRFRSAAVFQELRLPGSAPVRLFDIKKAIVRHRRLDSGRIMDFDLLIESADTKEAFADETARVPREVRLVVKRIPAAKGEGLLHRMARDERKRNPGREASVALMDFYTIDSRAFVDEEDDLVATHSALKLEKASRLQKDLSQREHEELVALKAVMEAPHSIERPNPHSTKSRRTSFNSHQSRQLKKRPQADPELRAFEAPAKKRILRGVPAMFRPKASDSLNRIRADVAMFEDLKTRTTNNIMTSFEIALANTGVQIPEYLCCSVCSNLLTNAICLHWDPQGRSACDGCVRGPISRDFRCPVSGLEGISPDELHKNAAIQQAADAFREQIMWQASDISGAPQKLERPMMPSQGSVPLTEERKENPRRKTQKKMEEDSASTNVADFGKDVFEWEEEECRQ